MIRPAMDQLKVKAETNRKRALADSREKAALYHAAFVQNPAGKKILDKWVMRYCMTPLSATDASLYQCGKAEGKRAMVKEILDHISMIDNLEG